MGLGRGTPKREALFECKWIDGSLATQVIELGDRINATVTKASAMASAMRVRVSAPSSS